MTARGFLDSLRTSTTRKVFTKALLVGCSVVVGVIIGAILVSHKDATQEALDSRKMSSASGGWIRRAVDKTMNRTPTPSGALYTRWGRMACPPSASLVYQGTMASGYSSHKGGASEYLCIVADPVSGTRVSAVKAYLVGVEFSAASDTLFSKVNMHGALTNQDAVCTVCRSRRSVQLMVPGRNTCMDGWTKEYDGYLMSSAYSDEAQRNFVCVDAAPEADDKGARAGGGAKFWPVSASCASLPCPKYIDGDAIKCAVCSQ